MTSARSVGSMRIAPHMRRSASVAAESLRRARRATKSAGGALAEVVVVALPLQRRDRCARDPGRSSRTAARRARGRAAWRSPSRGSIDDRAVQADLFLEARVRVIPVRAGLVHLEAIGERRARRDAVEADSPARHPCPRARSGRASGSRSCSRSLFVTRIVTVSPWRMRSVGAGHLAVDGDGRATRAGEVDRQLVDREIELRAAQHCSGRRAPARGTEHERSAGEPMHDATARDHLKLRVSSTIPEIESHSAATPIVTISGLLKLSRPA